MIYFFYFVYLFLFFEAKSFDDLSRPNLSANGQVYLQSDRQGKSFEWVTNTI